MNGINVAVQPANAGEGSECFLHFCVQNESVRTDVLLIEDQQP